MKVILWLVAFILLNNSESVSCSENLCESKVCSKNSTFPNNFNNSEFKSQDALARLASSSFVYGIAMVGIQNKISDNNQCFNELEQIHHGIVTKKTWAMKGILAKKKSVDSVKKYFFLKKQ